MLFCNSKLLKPLGIAFDLVQTIHLMPANPIHASGRKEYPHTHPAGKNQPFSAPNRGSWVASLAARLR